MKSKQQSLLFNDFVLLVFSCKIAHRKVQLFNNFNAKANERQTHSNTQALLAFLLHWHNQSTELWIAFELFVQDMGKRKEEQHAAK